MPSIPESLRQKRILLIDAEVEIVELVKSGLSKSYSITAAYDGNEALRHFQRDTFDLVISDRTMNEVISNDLADAVTAFAPGTPIVLLSGVGGLEVDTTRFAAFLRKPFTITELATIIEDLLPPADHHAR